MSDAARTVEARASTTHASSGSLQTEILLKRILQWSVLGTALVIVVFPMYWMLLTAFDPPAGVIGNK